MALRAETHGGFLDVSSSHSLKYNRLWACRCFLPRFGQIVPLFFFALCQQDICLCLGSLVFWVRWLADYIATMNISLSWTSAEKAERRRALARLPRLKWRFSDVLLRVRIDSEGWGQRSHPSHGCYVGNLYKHCFFQASQSLLTFVSEALMATCQEILLGLF